MGQKFARRAVLPLWRRTRRASSNANAKAPRNEFIRASLACTRYNLTPATEMDTRDHDANGNPKGLLDQIPQWLKSLHQMENELRNAARKGLLLRKDEAMDHLAQARQQLQQALDEAKGGEPPDGPRTPLRKEGEV